MIIQPNHLLFDLIEIVEQGITEIVLKNDRRFYVLESPSEVKKVIYYYALKQRDTKSAYFTEFYKITSRGKKYKIQVIKGAFDLNEIDYVTTEKLDGNDFKQLIDYIQTNDEICASTLMSDACMENIMIQNKVVNLSKVSRYIYEHCN